MFSTPHPKNTSKTKTTIAMFSTLHPLSYALTCALPTTPPSWARGDRRGPPERPSLRTWRIRTSLGFDASGFLLFCRQVHRGVDVFFKPSMRHQGATPVLWRATQKLHPHGTRSAFQGCRANEQSTANPQTRNLEFQGFDSSRFFKFWGGISRSIENSPDI